MDCKKNTRYKAHTSTIRVGVMVMFIFFLIGFTSAFEFDNIKTYDEVTKTATIENVFGLGETIADVQLKSDEVVQVGLGYQKVFEYEITSYTDYEKFFGELEIYNIKNDNTKENKQVDLKYLTYKEVEVEDWDLVCDFLKNGTEVCNEILVGTHKEQREVWNDLESLNVKAENLTISGWTEVNQGDYYEWIPNFAGVKVQEWATWSGNMSVGLLSYYNLNGNYNDSLGANNGTNYGTTNITGKVGSGINLSSTNYVSLGNNSIDMTDGNFTINYWVKVDSYAEGGIVAGASQGWNTAYGSAGVMKFGKNGVNEVAGSDVIGLGTWKMLTYIYDTSANLVMMYQNGVADSGGTDAYSSTFDAGVIYSIGNVGTNYKGGIDEIGIWTRALSATEVSYLYNLGNAGCSYGNESAGCIYVNPDTSPAVTLTTPTAYYNSTDKDIIFDCKATDDFLLQNITLYLNNSVNGTNTSVFNDTSTTFARSLADGYYSWNCGACDNASQCANGTAQYFWIDTQPTISILSPTENVSNYTETNIDFEAESDLSVEYWIINWNGTNYTTTNQEGTSLLESYDVLDGNNYHLLIYGNNSDTGVWGLNDTYYFSVDTTNPTILVTGGNASQGYHNISEVQTLEYVITETNLDDCWISYNGANSSINCTSGATNTTNITLELGVYNATIWANDTFGNEQSRFVEWNYLLLLNNQSYTSPVTEGDTSTFTANFYTNGSDINIAYFNYDSSVSYGTITDNGNNFFTITKSYVIPTVSADTVKQFNWTITQTYGNSTTDLSNQTVINIGIDNCSVNGYVLYNFTMLREETQVEINETGDESYAEINFQIYTYGTTSLVTSYNASFNRTNPFAICLNDTLTSEEYNIDVQVRYSAESYSSEFYHIQNDTLTSDDLSTNISLYLTNSTDDQEFKIIVKDQSSLPVSNALVYIYRKYIGESTFNIVEAPITDNNGETTAHLMLNDYIYSFLIIKNNVVLASFNNTIPVCQTPLVSTCTLEFVVYSGGVSISNFTREKDIDFTVFYNQTSRIVTTAFSIPSGNPGSMDMIVTTEDVASTSVCSDSITSSTGNLTCTVPATVGNTTIKVSLWKDGAPVGFATKKIDNNFGTIYSGVIVLLSLMVFLSIMGLGLTGNPILTVLFIFLGVVMLISLGLVTGNGWLGASATILYFLIAVVLLLIKGVRRS